MDTLVTGTGLALDLGLPHAPNPPELHRPYAAARCSCGWYTRTRIRHGESTWAALGRAAAMADQHVADPEG